MRFAFDFGPPTRGAFDQYLFIEDFGGLCLVEFQLEGYLDLRSLAWPAGTLRAVAEDTPLVRSPGFPLVTVCDTVELGVPSF